MNTLVLCRIKNAPVIEHSGNSGFPVSLREKCEYFTNDSGSLLVNNQMAFLRRGFLIAVERECPDMETVLSPVSKDAADIFGHIFKIPFVD